MQQNRDFRAIGFLRVASMILAVVVLLVGIVLMVGVLGAAANLPNALTAFQALGLGPLVNAVLTPLRAVMINAGIALFVIALVISLLFYTIARLLNAMGGLATRVARLEAMLPEASASTPDADQPSA